MGGRRRAGEGRSPGSDADAAHDPLGRLHDRRVVVLVEGVSDQIALEALARRLDADLHATAVMPTGGVHGLGAMIRAVRARSASIALLGLYDAAEAHVVRRALLAEGMTGPDDSLEHAGFVACTADLEDELIRACGSHLVQACLAAHGDLAAFRRLQGQPEWRGRPVEAQLRRWIGSGARRKLRYAQILVEAAPRERVPRPLAAIIDRAARLQTEAAREE